MLSSARVNYMTSTSCSLYISLNIRAEDVRFRTVNVNAVLHRTIAVGVFETFPTFILSPGEITL